MAHTNPPHKILTPKSLINCTTQLEIIRSGTDHKLNEKFQCLQFTSFLSTQTTNQHLTLDMAKTNFLQELQKYYANGQ